MNFLLIDDHPIVLEALSGMFRQKYSGASMTSVSSFENLQNILKTQKNFDGIFLDLNFDGELHGLDILKHLKSDETLSQTPTIILSMHSEPSIIQKAMGLKADGYVVKSDPPSEIFSAFENAKAGQAYLSTTAKASFESDEPILTGREIEIAKMVVDGKTSKAIGTLLSISPRTVETHRKNIMKKLNVNNSALLVKELEKRHIV